MRAYAYVAFVLSASAAIALADAPFGSAADAAPTQTTLKVTVQYTGPGQVSAERRIWVWLFDREPQMSGTVYPVAEQSISVNGGVATFGDIVPSRVWVTVIYDERGGFRGQAAPPSGSPAGAYLENNMPAPVMPGPNAAVQIVFADEYRIPQLDT